MAGYGWIPSLIILTNSSALELLNGSLYLNQSTGFKAKSVYSHKPKDSINLFKENPYPGLHLSKLQAASSDHSVIQVNNELLP